MVGWVVAAPVMGDNRRGHPCVDCGSTQRLSHCPVHSHDLPSGELAGFLPLFHTLEFFGLCSACQWRQGRTAIPG